MLMTFAKHCSRENNIILNRTSTHNVLKIWAEDNGKADYKCNCSCDLGCVKTKKDLYTIRNIGGVWLSDNGKGGNFCLMRNIRLDKGYVDGRRRFELIYAFCR